MTSPDIPEQFRLPTEIDYMIEARKLHIVFSSRGIVDYLNDHYIEQMNTSDSMSAFITIVDAIGRTIEPADVSTGQPVDSEMKTLQSFVQGAIAGRMLAVHVHRKNIRVLDSLAELKARNPEGSTVAGLEVDDFYLKHHFAEQYVEYGKQGLEIIGTDALDIIHQWEDQLSTHPDADKFSIGLGVVMFAARARHARNIEKRRIEELSKLRVEYNAAKKVGIDWDGGLALLVGGPKPNTSS